MSDYPPPSQTVPKPAWACCAEGCANPAIAAAIMVIPCGHCGHDAIRGKHKSMRFCLKCKAEQKVATHLTPTFRADVLKLVESHVDVQLNFDGARFEWEPIANARSLN